MVGVFLVGAALVSDIWHGVVAVLGSAGEGVQVAGASHGRCIVNSDHWSPLVWRHAAVDILVIFINLEHGTRQGWHVRRSAVVMAVFSLIGAVETQLDVLVALLRLGEVRVQQEASVLLAHWDHRGSG